MMNYMERENLYPEYPLLSPRAAANRVQKWLSEHSGDPCDPFYQAMRDVGDRLMLMDAELEKDPDNFYYDIDSDWVYGYRTFASVGHSLIYFYLPRMNSTGDTVRGTVIMYDQDVSETGKEWDQAGYVDWGFRINNNDLDDPCSFTYTDSWMSVKGLTSDDMEYILIAQYIGALDPHQIYLNENWYRMVFYHIGFDMSASAYHEDNYGMSTKRINEDLAKIYAESIPISAPEILNKKQEGGA